MSCGLLIEMAKLEGLMNLAKANKHSEMVAKKEMG